MTKVLTRVLLRVTRSDLTDFGLECLGPLTAPIDGPDVQGDQGLTLVPQGHPGAAFEAV